MHALGLLQAAFPSDMNWGTIMGSRCSVEIKKPSSQSGSYIVVHGLPQALVTFVLMRDSVGVLDAHR